MTSYTITLKENGKEQSANFPAPDRLPLPGDIYEFNRPCQSLGNVVYQPGDTLKIIERTDEAPHGRISSLGNLRVRGKQGVSIWTCVEVLIAEGLLELTKTRFI